MKLTLTLAMAIALLGAGLVGAYMLAALLRSSSSNRTYVRDEELAWMLVVAGLIFAGAVGWIWTRGHPGRWRPVWYAVWATVGIAAVSMVAAIVAAAALRGDVEFVIGGFFCLGAAGILAVWVYFWRCRHTVRPAFNATDGHLDLRCPNCGYRMVGLRESRCPECGTGYTLDELLGQQAFLPRSASDGAVVPEKAEATVRS